MTMSKQQLLLPSMALGLSCGVGFFVAQEVWQKASLNWPSIRKMTRRILFAEFIPWMYMAMECDRGFFPIAIWQIVKEFAVEEKEEDKADVDKDQRPYHEPEVTPRATNAVRKIGNTMNEAEPAIPFPPMMAQTIPPSTSPPQRQLEILVHNISHTDLVLSMDPNDGTPDGEYCLCRPRFSAFDLFTKRVLSTLSHQPETICFPRYERSDVDFRYTIVTPKPSRQKLLPTGFQLDTTNLALRVSPEELQSVRFRGKDAHRLDAKKKKIDICLDAVFFPLLAALIPRWKQQIMTKYPSSATEVKKVLILVSGVGTPRNFTHSIDGNSTEACSQLMHRFVNLLYPDVKVVRLHSQTNLFRFDENIVFAQRELRPCIDAYRDMHARGMAYPDEQQVVAKKDLLRNDTPFNPDWKKSFHLSLSYADGSSARTHAIQVALRLYRPSSYFFWQLKSFWHDLKVVDDDIEFHSFQEMETVPALEASCVVDTDTQSVIAEMKAFRQEFLESLEGRNDVREFWLRKTKKPVLAVLLVRIPGRPQPILYRGTNMEVSMPTGSLCAERNVIGTALASNPGLRREDLKMVAVLAVPLLERESVRSDSMTRNMSFASYSSIVMQEDESDEWVIPSDEGNEKKSLEKELTERTANLWGQSPNTSHHNAPFDMPVNSDPTRSTPPGTAPGTPVRRITLYSNSKATPTGVTKPTMGRKQSKRSVLIHSDKDLNPLRPCGACNEWLKKLAECNPNFSVLTFTDSECSGVYVTPCQE